MNWTGKPAFVLASGPSLGFDDYADVETIKNTGLPCITVNNTWEKARFCDVIYAGDKRWWIDHAESIDIDAERWTCSKPAATMYNGNYRDRKVKPGYNSGANAVEVAANVFNANPVILIGFDCSVKHGVHHHGMHKNKKRNPDDSRCRMWKKQFKSLVSACPKTTLINSSRYTEIKSIERIGLKEVLQNL